MVLVLVVFRLWLKAVNAVQLQPDGSAARRVPRQRPRAHGASVETLVLSAFHGKVLKTSFVVQTVGP